MNITTVRGRYAIHYVFKSFIVRYLDQTLGEDKN